MDSALPPLALIDRRVEEIKDSEVERSSISRVSDLRPLSIYAIVAIVFLNIQPQQRFGRPLPADRRSMHPILGPS
jgi:hypothetical protein